MRVVFGLPIVGVVSLICYIWWNAVVLSLFAGNGSPSFGSALVGTLATVGAFMTAWCYLVAALTHPGGAPSFLVAVHPTPLDAVNDDLPERLRNDSSSTGSVLRALRRRPPLTSPDGSLHCRLCKEVKPVRAHHDSVSGQCILKMDHFCPWVGNCIGLCNYKAFYQFIVYASATTTLVALANLEHIGGPSASIPSFHLLVASVLSLAFAIALLLFAGMHAVLITRNQTTLEAGMDIRVYTLGSARANWEAVFGRHPVAWWLPVPAYDAFVASRLGTLYRRPVGAPDALEEFAEWRARQGEWARSHPSHGWLCKVFPGLGQRRPDAWMFWWPPASHVGASMGSALAVSDEEDSPAEDAASLLPGAASERQALVPPQAPRELRSALVSPHSKRKKSVKSVRLVV
jgi:palmitoyltransferase ZDHHC2/15/20